jgi:EAL domain-containing protein (putative c-di-GMP-specific phosphodiesterase class I)
MFPDENKNQRILEFQSRLLKEHSLAPGPSMNRNLSGTSVVENAIVSSIASLADKLGIKTVAEFVETKEVLGQVESAGIHFAQGYFIKKPSPDLLL